MEVAKTVARNPGSIKNRVRLDIPVQANNFTITRVRVRKSNVKVELVHCIYI